MGMHGVVVLEKSGLAGADGDLLGPGRAEIALVGQSIAPLPALFAWHAHLVGITLWR
jgi:hypothetical protein